MQHLFTIAMAGVLLNATPACQDDLGSGPLPVDSIELSAQEQEKVKFDNQFTLDLFAQALSGQEGDENVMLSPLSVSMSVGMTANGARGATKDAIYKTLKYSNFDQEFLNTYYNKLIKGLPQVDPEVQVEIANSIWYKSDFKIEPKFIKTNESYYEAVARGLNFSDPKSVDIINRWVDEKTKGKIPSIVEEIPDDMRLYLINALYFKGAWETPFKKERTQTETFHGPSGDVETPFMHREGSMQVKQGVGFDAVALPYGEDKTYSMIAVLPDEGVDIPALLQDLNNAEGDWIGDVTSKQVRLALPKFTFSYENTLNDELSALGMGVAMSNQADFSGINKEGGLTISEVKHKTFIDVNEEGTEAAAVTSTGISVTSMPQYFNLTFDRPFVFFIRENSTGLILFAGLVNNPGK